MITTTDVRHRVAEIEAKTHDPEVAASLEHALWVDVLTTIARPGCVTSGALARAALKTRDIDFPRWRA